MTADRTANRLRAGLLGMLVALLCVAVLPQRASAGTYVVTPGVAVRGTHAGGSPLAPAGAQQPKGAVVISDAQHSAFVGLTKVGTGKYLAAWRQGTTHLAHNGDIWTSTSTDGTTWSKPAAKLTSNVLDIRDPGLTYVGGVTYMTYFTGDATHPAKGVYVTRSNDNGATWGAGVRVDGGMPYAGESGPVLALPSGQLLMMFYGHQAGQTLDSVFASTSSNGGNSWAAPVLVLDGQADGRDYQEPVPTLTSTGAVRVYYRWGTDSQIGSVDSAAAVTWSNARPLFTGTGRPGCQDNAGRVACIYRSIGAGPALLRTSTDDGATWSAETVWDASTNYMTYASLYPTGSQSWLVVYAMQATNARSTVYAANLALTGAP